MGENGAGKSTLVKVLTGVYDIDAGRIDLAGRPVRFASPLDAQKAGVSTVYQEVNLCPNLSVAENIVLGREPRRAGRILWPQMRRRAEELVRRLELNLDVSSDLGEHSIAVQQLIAIARALDVSAQVLVLDEPTSSLDTSEVEQLFRVIRQLRADGMAVLFITHFIDQVFAIADRTTVLRNGRLVGEYLMSGLTQVDLVTKMLGEELKGMEELEKKSDTTKDFSGAPVVVQADGLGRAGSVAPFSLTIHEGEVIGLAGLLGSGRSEAARLFFGADHADSGTLAIGEQRAPLRSPRAAMARGVALCPENRKTEGLILDLTIRENIILALQARRGWMRPVPRKRQDELVAKYIEALRIRPGNPEAIVGSLSGGNQQKVLLARWLISEPKLLILDEPTRGIDVGAKAEIMRLVVELSSGGMAVLFISAELEEVLRLSHRIAVLRDRRMVAQLTNDEGVDASVVLETIASGARA
jgi:simple sugar transport system ATP-binding protein